MKIKPSSLTHLVLTPAGTHTLHPNRAAADRAAKPVDTIYRIMYIVAGAVQLPCQREARAIATTPRRVRGTAIAVTDGARIGR